MTVEELSHHLERPLGRGHVPEDACTGAAGGAACGDLIRVSVRVDPSDPEGRIVDAGFDASGCGATTAAGSATVQLIRGEPLLAAAKLGAGDIAEELGGLSPAKRHAAELAADALHRALGWALRKQTRLAPAKRALVAMSGGVDSAVAALLVSESGEETVGVTLELWSDPENDGERSCCSAQAVRSAREIAHGMGMPHFSIDLREEFRAGVVEGWLEGYAAGLTPNPCVRCNGNVRLDAMLELAERLGANSLATGHYARVCPGENPSSNPRPNGDAGVPGPLLRVAVDEAKDQSYALAGLSPHSLARLRFPLGALTKPQVRARAQGAGLEVAKKPDSQDLCFLAGTDSTSFLAHHGDLRRRVGPIVDREGRTLGEHGGVHTVTIGQRRGLGIGGREGSDSSPLFVIATDPHANTVTVGPREELRTDSVSVRDVTLHRDGSIVDAVKVRYRGRRVPCRVGGTRVAGEHERIELEMAQQIERTAPGQIACLYAGDLIVGLGTIASHDAI
ncbi:MAG TPA: tRNA 2-thiouridine(34) synthase MnmA [Solirubrobacteraceae bacterium]|jgi:tRNA-specific 2-thiouridylase